MSSRPGLGAVWHGSEVTFTLRSPFADGADVCLADDEGRPTSTWPMVRRGDDWSTTVDGIGPGQLYGYRVAGPYAPDLGHRFNPAKLLVDPYARAVTGELIWNRSILGYESGAAEAERPSSQDSAGSVPWSVVVDPAFDWQDDRPPGHAWGETVIYEAHVKGLTMTHPQVPARLRGTYLGVAHEAIVEHLLSLGVTAIELLPVQHFASERHLAAAGLTNYWGYSPLAWFAPHAGYASGSRGRQVREFKTMVRALHQAGIEVLIDVVFNHTVEGGEEGPTLSLRGLDNASAYRTRPEAPERLLDFTGCGNTLDFASAAVVDLVHDSLIYWVEEMHVDGFRFDLAPVLGRDPLDFTSDGGLLRRLDEDPTFQNVKRIAEPWDLGPGGYSLGGFPAGWAEWNDRYRDAIRRFWRGDDGLESEVCRRLVGSADLFPERGACASINYVVAHDGFTLADLVSYAGKHNLANGEDNRDGSNHDHSANWGVEGPTSSTGIVALRRRLQRTLLATLALSEGVPMLGHGSELARTQQGNNNAYCQDNAISWIDWRLDGPTHSLLDFTRQVFRRRRELGIGCGAASNSAFTWIAPDGSVFDPQSDPWTPTACFGLLRQQTPTPQAIPAASLTVVNAGSAPVAFTLPSAIGGNAWIVLLDTAHDRQEGAAPPGAQLRVEAHSLACLVPSIPAAADG